MLKPRKMIRQLLLFSLLMGLFYSCKEKTSYQLRILIKNDTETDFLLVLVPKEEYLQGNLYDFSDIGGGAKNTLLEFTPGLEQELYITSDLKMQPHRLVEKVFNSIQINPSVGNERALKFSPDTVIGYTDNLFEETSDWKVEIRNFNLQTQFHPNPVESHDYIFVISQGKYQGK